MVSAIIKPPAVTAGGFLLFMRNYKKCIQCLCLPFEVKMAYVEAAFRGEAAFDLEALHRLKEEDNDRV